MGSEGKGPRGKFAANYAITSSEVISEERRSPQLRDQVRGGGPNDQSPRNEE